MEEKPETSEEERLLRAIFGERVQPVPPRPLSPEEKEAREKRQQDLKTKLGEVLDSLPEREKKVLELRFGLTDGYARTLEEIGKQFKVTRERIRQIEAKGLRKMRHPVRIQHVQEFLENEGD